MKSSFLTDVLKLTSGTIGGRIITIVSMPLATRLYSPEDFSVLSMYLAIVSPIAVIACFRFEVAIPLVKSRNEAKYLLAVSLFILTLMTCILFVIVGFHGNKLGSMFNNPKFIEYAWLVPFGVFLSGSYSALQYWATRERQFKAIAKTRVTQAIFGASTTLSLGAIGLSPLGLILGTILGNGAGSVNLARSALRNSLLPERLSIKRLVMVAMKNRNFASKSATEAILNVMGIQLSILIIAANSGPDGGHLFLAMQLMAVPLTLLGNSIAQVYLSRAPLEFRRGNLFEFTRKIMYRLAVAGALPLIAIGGIAPLFIPIVFGQEWQKSGEMMTLITPWMIVQFIASPISMVMYVTGKESQMLLLTSMGLLLRVGLVWLASTSGMSLVDAFALSSFLFYAICIVVFFNASQAKGVKVG